MAQQTGVDRKGLSFSATGKEEDTLGKSESKKRRPSRKGKTKAMWQYKSYKIGESQSIKKAKYETWGYDIRNLRTQKKFRYVIEIDRTGLEETYWENEVQEMVYRLAKDIIRSYLDDNCEEGKRIIIDTNKGKLIFSGIFQKYESE